MANKIVISELDIDINALIKSTAEAKNAIQIIKKEQDLLKASGQTLTDAYIKNEAVLKDVSNAYNQGIKVLSQSTKVTFEETNGINLLNLALNTEVTTIAEARAQNSLLNKLRNDTNATTKDGQEQIAKLNSKLDENNAFIKENADQYLKQKINIGNYRTAITGALQDSGLFGGKIQSVTQSLQGFSGVFGIMKNEVKTGSDQIRNSAVATEGMTSAQKALSIATGIGTGAMRIFSVALAATGIGLIIGAVVLLIGYFKTFDPLIDKIEQGFAAMGAAVRVVQQALASLFSSTDDSSKSFKNLGDNMAKAAKDASNLKAAQQDLADLQNSQEVANAKASQQYDELILKSKNRTLTEKERLAFLTQAEAIETANFKQRSALADADLKQSIEAARIKGELSNQELANLQRNTIAYGTYLLNQGKITDKELQDLKESELGKIAIKNESVKRLEKNQNAQDKLEDDAQAKTEKAKADAIKAQEEAEARRKTALDNAVKLSQSELDLFLSSQGIKAKSLSESLKLAEVTYQKQLEINQKEFNASQKTEVDKLELKKKNNEATNALLQTQNDLVIANADRELQIFKDNNQSKIDANKFLTDALVQQEIDRLNRISEAEAEAQTLRLQNGVINEQQYQDAIKAIDDEFKANKEALEAEKKQADADKKVIDLENQRIADNASFEEQLAYQLGNLERSRLQELANAEKTGADKNLINKKFEADKLKIQQATKDAELALTANTLGQIRGLLKENTVVAKALGVAEATINTYLGATKALATLPAPYGAIQAGVTIASGLGQVAKIAGVQFAGGGFVEATGPSHAQGGIPIEIGGQYFGEMQGGEGLAIMNKGAFNHFKAFNNTFGDSDVKGNYSSGFMASGGIITQGVQAKGVDTNTLVNGLIDAISVIPAPQVAVTDIHYQSQSYTNVVDGANF